MNAPKLRFKEYNEDWNTVRLKSLFIEVNEKTGNTIKFPLYSLTVQDGVTKKTERYNREFLVKKEDNFKIVRSNYFVSNPMNMTIGALAQYKGSHDISVSGYYNVFKNISKYKNQFLEDYLKSSKMIWLYKSVATGSLIEKQRVHFTQFIELAVKLPDYKEANKISDFMETLTKSIRLQQEKVDLLKEQKKGYMQKIFSQELRFRDDAGQNFTKWKKVKLGKLTKKTGKKNSKGIKYPVAAISNKKGFILEGDRNYSNASVDIKAYKLVHFNEFAYNPARINVGSFGFQNITDTAIVSSLYVVFETLPDLLNSYLKVYMYSRYFNQDVVRNTEGSVREYLFYESFCNIQIPLPCVAEQKKIAEFLTKLDSKILLEERYLEQLNDQKKAFMQQMFI